MADDVRETWRAWLQKKHACTITLSLILVLQTVGGGFHAYHAYYAPLTYNGFECWWIWCAMYMMTPAVQHFLNLKKIQLPVVYAACIFEVMMPEFHLMALVLFYFNEQSTMAWVTLIKLTVPLFTISNEMSTEWPQNATSWHKMYTYIMMHMGSVQTHYQFWVYYVPLPICHFFWLVTLACALGVMFYTYNKKEDLCVMGSQGTLFFLLWLTEFNSKAALFEILSNHPSLHGIITFVWFSFYMFSQHVDEHWYYAIGHTLPTCLFHVFWCNNWIGEIWLVLCTVGWCTYCHCITNRWAWVNWALVFYAVLFVGWGICVYFYWQHLKANSWSGWMQYLGGFVFSIPKTILNGVREVCSELKTAWISLFELPGFKQINETLQIVPDGLNAFVSFFKNLFSLFTFSGWCMAVLGTLTWAAWVVVPCLFISLAVYYCYKMIPTWIEGGKAKERIRIRLNEMEVKIIEDILENAPNLQYLHDRLQEHQDDPIKQQQALQAWLQAEDLGLKHNSNMMKLLNDRYPHADWPGKITGVAELIITTMGNSFVDTVAVVLNAKGTNGRAGTRQPVRPGQASGHIQASGSREPAGGSKTSGAGQASGAGHSGAEQPAAPTHAVGHVVQPEIITWGQDVQHANNEITKYLPNGNIKLNDKAYTGPAANTNNTVRLHCVLKARKMLHGRRKVHVPLQAGVAWYGANSQNLNCNDQWQPFPVGPLNYRVRYRQHAMDTNGNISQRDAHELCFEMPPGHWNFNDVIKEFENKRLKIC